MLKLDSYNSKETLNREWIVTNGIGGYSSSTISGANTRRYHGLLVATHNPPVQREILVSKTDESIILPGGNRIDLGTGLYPCTVFPKGFEKIESFERTPIPRIVFSVRKFLVCKSIFMVNGSNTTVIEYENKGKKSAELSITPSFVHRDYHNLFKEDTGYDYYYELEKNKLKIHSHYGSIPLFVSFSKGKFAEERNWIRNNEYIQDLKRGQESLEDVYRIGNIIFTLEPDEKAYVVFSTEPEMSVADPVKLKESEIQRISSLIPGNTEDSFLADLCVSADQFLVKRKSTERYTVIAGYHWFTDWGRDTMIALQGLGIETGKKDISRSVLETFFSTISMGMLPNRFPDNQYDYPEYNTIDATLWLFDTVYKYYKKFGDKEFIRENLHHLEGIILSHINGTRYNIHLTEEGFIYGGEGLSQLTWMDARIGDHVVTPRHGCPVEIQALWFNALNIYLYFSSQLKIGSSLFNEKVKELSKKIKTNFPVYFFNEYGYLHDVIIPGISADPCIRPNQIYALSLPFPLIDKKKGKSILATIEKSLYTPFGLRTLSSEHIDFRPVYEGNQWKRDTAYHQGTVWTFLLSDYFEACMYVHGNTPEVSKKIKESVDVLRSHFYESGCINGVSEIFDGIKPVEGKGAANQAWSVSALIRILSLQKNQK